MGQGVAEIDLYAPDDLYDEILKEIVGVEIQRKRSSVQLMQDFAHAKAEYDQVSDALKMVKQTAMESLHLACRYEPGRTGNHPSGFTDSVSG